MITYNTDNHAIAWSYDHMIIWSQNIPDVFRIFRFFGFDSKGIRTYDHMVAWSCDRMIIWSYDHMITKRPLDFWQIFVFSVLIARCTKTASNKTSKIIKTNHQKSLKIIQKTIENHLIIWSYGHKTSLRFFRIVCRTLPRGPPDDPPLTPRRTYFTYTRSYFLYPLITHMIWLRSRYSTKWSILMG